MAEIVNLRRARKAKAQADKVARAAERRAAFGRPKSETSLSEAKAEVAQRLLDGHRLERDDEPR